MTASTRCSFSTFSIRSRILQCLAWFCWGSVHGRGHEGDGAGCDAATYDLLDLGKQFAVQADGGLEQGDIAGRPRVCAARPASKGGCKQDKLWPYLSHWAAGAWTSTHPVLFDGLTQISEEGTAQCIEQQPQAKEKGTLKTSASPPTDSVSL